jgi:tetratricopeptide (TPR) repeat protein
MGLVYQAQGLYDKALESFQQALAIIQEIGEREEEG